MRIEYLPFEPNAAHLFFQLVSRRYERGSFLITSNRTVSEWGTVFGDAVAATVILDRLLHHSHVVTIRGDSYRLKEKRRAGVVPRVFNDSSTRVRGLPDVARGQILVSLDTTRTTAGSRTGFADF